MYVENLEWLYELAEGLGMLYSAPGRACRQVVVKRASSGTSSPTYSKAMLALKLKVLIEDFLFSREWSDPEREVIRRVLWRIPIDHIERQMGSIVLSSVSQKIEEYRVAKGILPKVM